MVKAAPITATDPEKRAADDMRDRYDNVFMGAKALSAMRAQLASIAEELPRLGQSSWAFTAFMTIKVMRANQISRIVTALISIRLLLPKAI
mmetsp:Transcript_52201/g.97960  ORF Transcript_52201/g.97960 Transcript_52201/m.97960 type:complete len:91 (-) Transcript_52201:123-395(-)